MELSSYPSTDIETICIQLLWWVEVYEFGYFLKVPKEGFQNIQQIIFT